MSKKRGYKKWWRFNDVPVVFVEPGVDPAMARRQFGYRIEWGKKSTGGSLGLDAIIAIVSAIILVVGGGWWFFGRGESVSAQAAATPTATMVTEKTSTPVVLTPKTPYIRKPWFDPTPTATPHPTPTATPMVLESIAVSPVQPPEQRIVVVTSTPTPTPPHAYEVIANNATPSNTYSYVSGWIVEMDGKTPRPVAVELAYPTAKMMFPRPNNTDIANGHFEFMVSPGDYVLQVLDADAPAVPVHVTDTPMRIEISFRHTRPGATIAPVRSVPWAGAQPMPTPTPTTATPAQTYSVFLPLVVTDRQQYTQFLPLVVK